MREDMPPSKTVESFQILSNFLVQMRLKAIRNIGKITKSMKMIASTKLNRAQKAMDIGRQFGTISQRNSSKSLKNCY